MKVRISIIQNNLKIEMIDQTDKKMPEYIKDFKSLFDTTEKIKAIETINENKHDVLILRPGSIDSIKIEEI